MKKKNNNWNYLIPTKFKHKEILLIKHGFYRGEIVSIDGATKNSDTGEIEYTVTLGKESLVMPEYMLKRMGLIQRLINIKKDDDYFR